MIYKTFWGQYIDLTMVQSIGPIQLLQLDVRYYSPVYLTFGVYLAFRKDPVTFNYNILSNGISFPPVKDFIDAMNDIKPDDFIIDRYNFPIGDDQKIISLSNAIILADGRLLLTGRNIDDTIFSLEKHYGKDELIKYIDIDANKKYKNDFDYTQFEDTDFKRTKLYSYYEKKY